MDAVVNGALEEICSKGAKGLAIRDLWSKIQSHLNSNSLPLCTNVKQALWSNLLSIPSLRFECNGVSYDAENPRIQSFEDSELLELKIVAAEHLLNSFVGICDIQASDAGISQIQRRVLERLAIARTDGITQNDLAKEFGIKSNNIYYILRNLETRGLIVRQSTIVRKKENDGEHKNSSIVNTNMLYLYRYAKHLGSLQRIEIIKEDRDGVPEESIKEDVHIKDYVPALKAICDMLEKADGKVLVVLDIKKELGYSKTSGHRAWRNVLQKLKGARLVEECYTTVNNKKVPCLRLLKKFSPESCEPKSSRGVDDNLDTEQLKPVKRGQITEQILELPIEQQIYDMIDAAGSKGLTLNEVYKRLGINNKRYYTRILDMVSRFRMHLASESLNRGVVYRVWTRGNYNITQVSNTPPRKSTTDAQVGELQLARTDHLTSKVDDGEDDDEVPVASSSSALDSRSSFDPNPDAEPQIANSKPAASSSSPAPRSRRSYLVYPCLGLNSVSSLREQRIIEKLEEDKVLIKPELHRLLESLGNLENPEKKHTMMDKKTLDRSLNKLQEEGLCKCISFAVPSVTNYGRKRTIEVVLHPSVYNAEDLSDRVHEKMRSFEKQIRNHNISPNKSIPVLNEVERIQTNSGRYAQHDMHEAMRNNGFVLARMVRAKLLHIFLWNHLTKLPNWDDGSIISGRLEEKNPYSTCKLFELDAAIKAMPLELFLQVVGSSVKFEGMIEKCSNGLCLSDLPVNEYRSLMDLQATSRLSSLIDILRRLKLIRLIGEEVVDAPVGPHATLRHSLELKPYIEEPVRMVVPSADVNSFDLRPHVRHDFVLATRKCVEEYWNTLEYCYAASDPKAALHAFPGSAVHEVFLIRSWGSVRVMTADQRSKLLKIVANEDPTKKITYKKCGKIAEDLKLTLEQVLRVFYDKRQKHNKYKEAASMKEQESHHALLPYKRKRSSKKKPVNNEKTLVENPLDQELNKMFSAEDETDEQNSSQKSIEDDETHMSIDELDNQKEAANDLEINADEDDHDHPLSNVHKLAISKCSSSRQKRFAWTENTDRELVIEYVRHRAALGPKFHRTVWTSLENLPAPPETCRRRMSTLNRNNQFRKTLMRLCNILTIRYANHLKNSNNKTNIIQDDENALKERWDDFDNKDIKTVLDEVLRCKQVAKFEATKDARYISKFSMTDGAQEHEFDESNSATPNNGRKKARVRRSVKCHLPKSYAIVTNGGKDFGKQTYKSLAVSNAIELLKLVYLSTAKAPEVSNLLAETLRRYSEHDILSAFNYLRDRNFMVKGSNGINEVVLSQNFSHNRSSSPFPPNTGEKAVKMCKWLNEKENDLLNTEVDLYADVECGDVLQLCVLVCEEQLSIFPYLPEEGVGENTESKKHNHHDEEDDNNNNKSKKQKIYDSEIFYRKEKGFPGIQLTVSRDIISPVDEITNLPSSSSGSSLNLEENSSSSLPSSEITNLPSDVLSMINGETIWEGMSCYARHVASLEVSAFLFESVYSAIRKAGDQGLSLQDIIDIQQGEKKIPELIVQVLETFGRAFKVNGYDCVHVVDSLYRSKYLLAIPGSNQQGLELKVSETCTNNEKENDVLMKENDKDTSRSNDDDDDDKKMHKVTILNHQPEEEVEEEVVVKEKVCEIHISDSPCYKPILPWINGDGTINKKVYKGLVRRLLGIVMQNPGILEEHVISQMNVLNPQSCRTLLEVMILDGHIMVRKMYQSVSSKGPPGILVGFKKKQKMVCRQHLFANPKSISFL